MAWSVKPQQSVIESARGRRFTSELFKPGRFDRIVTDMGRPEGDKAGIDLVDPISGPRYPHHHLRRELGGDQLKGRGIESRASGITSSATTLLKLLNVEDERGG